ncbi:Glutamyl-tRNA(Gln) amidotransferase subunit A [Bienertia sinuspersici]
MSSSASSSKAKLWMCGCCGSDGAVEPGPGAPTDRAVQLQILDRHVVLDNGIVQVTISKPGGIVTGIAYNGIENLLEVRNKEENRGYWDLVWNDATTPGTFDTFVPLNFICY